MFMKKYHYLLTILFTLFFVSCFEDETTIADMTSLSEITIKEGSIKAVYNINKNETLVIFAKKDRGRKSTVFFFSVRFYAISPRTWP